MVNAERKSEILSIEYVVDKKTLRNGFKNKCWESKSSRLCRNIHQVGFFEANREQLLKNLAMDLRISVESQNLLDCIENPLGLLSLYKYL